MRHDIEETVVAAMMSHEPVIIVEGQDDIKFYSNIASRIHLNVGVQAVETIEGYGEGCDQVITAIGDAQALIAEDARLSKYILGIIDRDSRYYMNNIPDMDNILVLKYYSYESHLVTNKSIRKLLGIMTKANRELLTDEAVGYIYNDFEGGLKELYYFSLEALKAQCVAGYDACVVYGDEPGKYFSPKPIREYWNKISEKIEELDQFAAEKNISMKDIRKVAKGKWYLFCWCRYIIQKAKTLETLCGNKLPRCIYCEIGNQKKCLWRQDCVFQMPNIKSILYSEEIIDMDEVGYIADRMRELAS